MPKWKYHISQSRKSDALRTRDELKWRGWQAKIKPKKGYWGTSYEIWVKPSMKLKKVI